MALDDQGCAERHIHVAVGCGQSRSRLWRSLDKTPVFGKNHRQTKIRGERYGGGYDGHGGGAARSAAAVALHAQTDNAVVARRLVRILRPVLHRLYRHRAVQGENLHADDPRPVRPERLCQFRRRAVHRPVHRHARFQLAVRPLRPALDLHLRAVVVLGRRLHHGVSGHRGEHRSVALDRQHRARRRTGERRRLCVGAGAQEPARAGLRLQPVHHVHRRAGGRLHRLAIGAADDPRPRRLALGGHHRLARRRGDLVDPPQLAGIAALARSARPHRRSRAPARRHGAAHPRRDRQRPAAAGNRRRRDRAQDRRLDGNVESGLSRPHHHAGDLQSVPDHRLLRLFQLGAATC